MHRAGTLAPSDALADESLAPRVLAELRQANARAPKRAATTLAIERRTLAVRSTSPKIALPTSLYR